MLVIHIDRDKNDRYIVDVGGLLTAHCTCAVLNVLTVLPVKCAHCAAHCTHCAADKLPRLNLSFAPRLLHLKPPPSAHL